MSEAGEWHRLQETTTATTTSYPIRQLCRSGRASECGRPKVDNTFRSFSVCLPEIEEESRGIQHRLFLPEDGMNGRRRCGGYEVVVGFGRANFAWPIEKSGCAACFFLCLTDDRHFEGHKVGGALSPGLIPEPSSSRHCRLRHHSITRPSASLLQDREDASGQ